MEQFPGRCTDDAVPRPTLRKAESPSSQVWTEAGWKRGVASSFRKESLRLLPLTFPCRFRFPMPAGARTPAHPHHIAAHGAEADATTIGESGRLRWGAYWGPGSARLRCVLVSFRVAEVDYSTCCADAPSILTSEEGWRAHHSSVLVSRSGLALMRQQFINHHHIPVFPPSAGVDGGHRRHWPVMTREGRPDLHNSLTTYSPSTTKPGRHHTFCCFVACECGETGS